MSTNNHTDYATIDQAAQDLQVCRASIYNYIKAGVLNPYEQVAPHRILIKKAELNLLKRVRPKS